MKTFNPALLNECSIILERASKTNTYSALEAEIEQSRTHVALLLQAVLKEAFAQTHMS